MIKIGEASTTFQAWHGAMNMSSQGPWRVKEWKKRHSPARSQLNPETVLRRIASRPPDWMQSGAIRQDRRLACHIDHIPDSSRCRYGKTVAIWLSACAIAVVTAVAIWSSSQQQLEPSTKVTLSSPLHSQPQVPNRTYHLQLGSYDEAIGARYAWTAYQASLGDLLEKWEPRFEWVRNEDSSSHRILAGAFSERGEANRLCARLQKRNVPCAVVEL